MTRRKWIILGALLLLLTIVAELVVRPWNAFRGCVQVVNQGDTTMDDLVVRYGDTKLAVDALGAGQSTKVWFTVGEKGPLTLEFNQKGNPMKGFQMPDFDPADNLRNGFKLVLIVKNNQVERFVDDEDSATPLKRLKDSISGWFETDVMPPP